MKILSVFLLLISLTITGFSQYSQFIDKNKLWVEEHSWEDVYDPRPPESSIYFVYFEGDTVINDTTYQKLYRQRFFLDTWYTNDASHLIDSTLKQAEEYAYLREDTINKKVYEYSYDIDRLIYDFSMNIGDSISEFDGTFSLDSIVDITLDNGSVRKKYFFSDSDQYLTSYYIEGIGGENGILSPFRSIPLSGIDASNHIICYSEDSIELYGTCNQPDYVITKTSDLVDSQYSIKLYPNPSNNQALIDLGEVYETIKITILDIKGAALIEKTYNQEQFCDIKLHSLDRGIYLVNVEINKKSEISTTLIKQ